jgi:4-diphosphocytidyl-2-C-methyl-D-erythritol kinase
MEALTFPAPAKLNLFLHVVGRRADGYHELETVFRFLDFGDVLHITPRTDGVIVLTHPLPGVPVEQDLCWRAARLLQLETGCRLGAEIALEKCLPLGGGLGGGSSDAATVLLALNHLWGTGLSRAALQALGLRLGADVPVFVFGRSAFARGVGETLTEIALPSASYVVLMPRVVVPTAAIFADPGLTRNTPRLKIAVLPDDGGRNDMQPLVLRRYPEVALHLEWLSRFEQHAGAARMTGSGACVFAPFVCREAAQRVFDQRPPGMQGFVADGIDRHPLFDLV